MLKIIAKFGGKMKDKFIKSLNGMSIGLFSSLIIGLILKQIGNLFALDFLIRLGTISQFTMGASIGVAVAYYLNSSPLVIAASAVTGLIGSGSLDSSFLLHIGDPVGAYISSFIPVLLVNKITKKTNLDLILLPSLTILIGFLISNYTSPFIITFVKSIGIFINKSSELNPITMGIILSTLMGILLTLPISSSAIAISLNLSGIAAGAALTGCCCQMIGFAIISYKDNNIGTSLSIAFGTSMIQVPNIIKNPLIWIPPIVSSMILGPISSYVFKFSTNSVAAGMGTSGLVGQISSFSVIGKDYFLPMIILHFLGPAILNFIIYEYMLRKNYIKKGDLKI